MKKNLQPTSAPKNIPHLEVIKLWTKAGARCEFPGCNKYLWRDDLTQSEANFGQNAHVVARSLGGPRGGNSLPLSERNKAENLMLLCLDHHKLIDSKEHRAEYPDELLYRYKQEHEERVFYFTGHNGARTHLIRVKAKIAGEAVEIPNHQIRDAVVPMYPLDNNGTEINLTELPDIEDPAYWNMGVRMIDQQIEPLYAPAIGRLPHAHYSVFALGSIPLLVYLGHKLSNKITTELFQRHRDTQDWKWKSEGDIVNFETHCLQQTESGDVALILSLSGKIALSDLPEDVRTNYTVYEIIVSDTDPNPMLFGRRESLLNFQNQYQAFIRGLKNTHGKIDSLSLFPAIPAPIAVACGRDLLKKIDPSLKVFDNNKKNGGFSHVLTVN